MQVRAHTKRSARPWILLIISTITLLAAFFGAIPVVPALQAGIGGLGIVVFGSLLAIILAVAGIGWRNYSQRSRLSAALMVVTALISLLIPSVSYSLIAKHHGVSLRFDPSHYLAFTGDSIAPAKTLAYKTVEGKQLHLALYQKDISKTRPTVVLVHGGGWQFGNYKRTNNWPKLFRDAGYQVVSVEYRLASPENPTWDKTPVDIHDAVDYIQKYSDALGVDPNRLALFGQSAGGHLALLEAYTSQSVRAVVGLYPPTDLDADYRLSKDKDSELAFIGGPPEQFPSRYDTVSVPRFVSSLSPQTLLLQGQSDDIVDASSSQELSKRLNDSNVINTLVVLPYTGHSFDNQAGGFATQIAEQATLDFLLKALR